MRRAHSPTVHIVKNAKYGKILVTPKGMTLYYFTPDKPNKSTCSGGCAKAWPPYMLPAGVKAPVKPAGFHGTLGSIARGKGRQVTYDKRPLYTFASDKKPGETLGEGVAKVWYVVKV